MKTFNSQVVALVLIGLLFLSGCRKSASPANQSAAANQNATPPANTTNAASLNSTSDAAPAQKFSDAELDELFAPIALYPDPLLAQMVPAATFFEQLAQAQQTLGGKSDDNLIADQSWDVSVKSVAHYPPVLKMMVDKQDWTTAIGQAYVNQPQDVSKSIQRLRAEAKEAGSLVTTKQQQVISEGNVIKIVPAEPQVIYVPEYNPEVVYVDNGPSTGEVVAAAAISFGVGLAIGAWLNNDWNYYGPGPYYHGWAGGGWVGVNRAYVNVNRNVYINDSFRNVNVNRNVVNRNISNYRTDLNRNATVRQNNIARNNLNRNDVTRNNIDRNNISRNNLNRSNTARNNPNRTNTVKNRTNNATGNRAGTKHSRPGANGGGQQRSFNSGGGRRSSSGQRRSGGGARRRG
jgi:hypothetical protein